MKQVLIILIIASAIVFGCKNNDNKPATKSKEMSYTELSKILGDQTAFNLFDSAGKTEADAVARGQRKVKNNATVSVWMYDLVLTVSQAGAITYTVSSNARWGGVTRFPESLSTDGAVALYSCNKYWQYPGTSTSPILCNDAVPAGVSKYQAFTSDHDYQIHISNMVTVNN